MPDSWLILDTSSRVGRVGLAMGDDIVAEVNLDETRRHARDLAATCGQLLSHAGLSPRSLRGVMVSQGPGSFTGLRVGIMSAKAFAYAAGCELRAVPTFEAIASRTRASFQTVDVIADALQKHVYVQSYRCESGLWKAEADLRIAPLQDWLAGLIADRAISGPGVAAYQNEIPATQRIVESTYREATVESLFRIGLQTPSLSANEHAALEPLYLRGSSAEEKAKAAKSP